MSPAKAVEAILPDLESGDAFARLDAERRLLAATKTDFGFRWNGTDGDRARAVDRVRAWVEERRKAAGRGARSARRAEAAAAATLEIAKAQGLDPKAVSEKLQEILAQNPALAGIALGRPACSACARRPATVEIVDIADRRASKVVRLCEPCAAKAGGAGS